MHLAFVLNNAPAGACSWCGNHCRELLLPTRPEAGAPRAAGLAGSPYGRDFHLTVFNRPSSHARIFWEDSALLCAAYDKLQRQQTDRGSLKRAIIAAERQYWRQPPTR
jgi:hypothetical protein